MVTSDVWEFPYSRQKAAFPLEFVLKINFGPLLDALMKLMAIVI